MREQKTFQFESQKIIVAIQRLSIKFQVVERKMCLLRNKILRDRGVKRHGLQLIQHVVDL